MNQPNFERGDDCLTLLESAEFTAGQIEVRWRNSAETAQFSPFWLRDHCHAKHSLNADTLQREVNTFAIPHDIAPAKLEIKDGGSTLCVLWRHDQSSSIFPAKFLWNVAQDDGRSGAPPRTLWDRDSMGKNFPSVSHDEVMGS